MKAKIKLFCLIICCLFSSAGFATTYGVTMPEALSIAQRQFQGKDVDYYILEDTNSSYWTIFVDADPMKGWEHECYVITVFKTTTTSIDNTEPRSMEQHKLPPSGNFVPLSVKNRYGSNSGMKPKVAKSTQANAANPAAEHTYAIILSGGIQPTTNHERYWNDCSFIYQTLVNKYGVPKENIFPIMSDGDDPAKDMMCTTGAFKSQPLDLDNDGVAEIKLAATKSNIKSTLNLLKNKLQEDDHLFFYVIDHGGSVDGTSSSYICLWNEESLYDYELAKMLEPFTEKDVNVNVVLGQCNSGGFIDDLSKIGCVVAAACRGNESSWGCFDKPFDEFVYHWTCAVNGADHNNIRIQADNDNNERVTMQEAFQYAKTHDRRTAEHPQYVSTPISIGEDLAFNNIPQSVDLYLKDNPEDTGKEPNKTTKENWKSPSIWVRNQADGKEEHENPLYTSDHETAYVYVKIHNRGKKDYTGGKFILVYWAQASTGLTAKAWKGREIYKDENTSQQFATGGMLEAAHIDSIKAGGFRVVKIRWSLPRLLEYYPEGNFHFCLLGKIMDTPYDDGYKDGETYFEILANNDQAQKNVTIVRRKDIAKEFNVFVRNTLSTQKDYTLELIPRTAADAAVYSYAKLELAMSPKVYAAWERGGLQHEDLEFTYNSANSTDIRKVRFLSPQSKLKKVSLRGNEFDVVSLKFDFKVFSLVGKTYTFDLVQKDENGNIIGGETFIVEAPTFSQNTIEISPSSLNNGYVQLNAENSDFTSYSWQDNSGNKLGEGSTITVLPTASNTRYTVTAINEEGEVAEGAISLDNLIGIKSASSEDGCINVALRGEASDKSRITISSMMTGSVITSVSLTGGESEVSIDVPNNNDNVYIVSYLIDDVIIDSRKVTYVR